MVSPDTARLILKLHPTDDKYLFPMGTTAEKMGDWIRATLRSVPALKNEKGLGTKYIRHSIISSKLYTISKLSSAQQADDLSEFADRSFHGTGQQKEYATKIKDESGKIINIDPKIFKEWDDITLIRTGDEPEEDEGEEEVSKPTKSRKKESKPLPPVEEEAYESETEEPARTKSGKVIPKPKEPPAKTSTGKIIPPPKVNLVGKKVLSTFENGKSFVGEIIRYNPKNKKYIVVYDDPDDDGEYKFSEKDVLKEISNYDRRPQVQSQPPRRPVFV